MRFAAIVLICLTCLGCDDSSASKAESPPAESESVLLKLQAPKVVSLSRMSAGSFTITLTNASAVPLVLSRHPSRTQILFYDSRRRPLPSVDDANRIRWRAEGVQDFFVLKPGDQISLPVDVRIAEHSASGTYTVKGFYDPPRTFPAGFPKPIAEQLQEVEEGRFLRSETLSTAALDVKLEP